jgi:hypothetical protein
MGHDKIDFLEFTQSDGGMTLLDYDGKLRVSGKDREGWSCGGVTLDPDEEARLLAFLLKRRKVGSATRMKKLNPARSGCGDGSEHHDLNFDYTAPDDHELWLWLDLVELMSDKGAPRCEAAESNENNP